jgi:pimeloyl-ACP methyl ester carboxylesterase
VIYRNGIWFDFLFTQTGHTMNSLPKSIVFITGSFISNNCWNEWKPYFESKGYKCIAPSWPYKDASPEDLRNRHPDHAIASNRLVGLIDYFAAIINTLADKPILIGHSLGGLIVQLLLQTGLGSAGVAVHSFPPAGINTFNFSFVKSVWETMAFFTSSHESYLVSFRKWKRSFANGMSCIRQKELYYKYATPESKAITRDAFKCSVKIDFNNLHAPLLFTSGGRDQIIPASLNHINYKNYKTSNSVTCYKVFADHGHLVFDFPEWKEEAEYILIWLQSVQSLKTHKP